MERTEDSELNGIMHDCLTKEMWSAEKRVWCCERDPTMPQCNREDGGGLGAPLGGGAVYLRAKNGAEVMYEAPNNVRPRAILFLAHGCNHQATDFWPKSRECKQCLGLPEERRIVNAALKRRYVAIAVSSEDRKGSRCWSDRDGALAADAVKQVMHDNGWSSLPIVALGASSGGWFVGGIIAEHLDVVAVDMQIMALPDPPAKMPPIAFTYMSRDTATAHYVDMNAKDWKAAKVPTLINMAKPLPITPTFFSDRISAAAGMSRNTSQAIYNALRDGNFLDKSTGLLLQDPRRTKWREAVRSAVPQVLETDSLVPDESGISEELNVAWCMHEFTADFVEDTFDFFDEMLAKPPPPPPTTATTTQSTGSSSSV